ncbi:sensor domain-containing diguanylate cyclase [Roseomonas frigidaquae]|uniref:Sensor domain-containing diguanylate cyclase n=1 Tax=Falsiroseomonas frigidaquae TaxID=487318 RepID=A0ABX1ESN1_9PROT|nr:sensor domain-containing diguanylate cyclase [Falsiroseomonas frigidaquae]NKE43636.1 sensor domain-containing diguanylate cyclase [Falsiroseomonas frigidaquae]
MPAAALPANEAERLAALDSYEILDTACESAFDDLARLAARLTGTPIGLVTLLDRDRQWFKAHYGLDVRQTPRELSFCSHAILNPDQALVVRDATEDPRFADNPVVQGETGLRFYAGVPLVNPAGHPLGTLCVLDHRPRQLLPEQVETLKSLARTVATALELRRAMREVRRMALTDPLTGLGNRPAFLAALRAAIARQRTTGGGFSLFYADLDGMKRVNDVHGHAAGDSVIQSAAGALRDLLGAEEHAARLGGDEFAAVLMGTVGLTVRAEALRAKVKAVMDSRAWPVTVSVGAVAFERPPADEDEALMLADQLMYSAKHEGRNRVACVVYRLDRSLAA